MSICLYRFALDNFGQLTEKDISILSEYPLHQLGSLGLPTHCNDEHASIPHMRKRALDVRSEATYNSEDSDEVLNPSKRARVGEEASEETSERVSTTIMCFTVLASNGTFS